MPSKDYHPPMFADHIYHVYNKANSNRELLFESEENYRFFLQRYAEMMLDFVDTYTFVLIPNHFHLMVQVKSEEQIFNFVKNHRRWEMFQQATIPELVSEAFRRFFISYTKSFNNYVKPKRSGKLFLKDFKRVLVDSDDYFTFLIQYIHLNPVKHKLSRDFANYQWSSYWRLLKNKNTLLKRPYIMDWFGGQQAFINFHKDQLEAHGFVTFDD